MSQEQKATRQLEGSLRVNDGQGLKQEKISAGMKTIRVRLQISNIVC